MSSVIKIQLSALALTLSINFPLYALAGCVDFYPEKCDVAPECNKCCSEHKAFYNLSDITAGKCVAICEHFQGLCSKLQSKEGD